MPTFRTGHVERILSERTGMQRLAVRVGTEVRTAILYPRYTAPAVPGDPVVVNTTAEGLGLGSGGADFVLWNLAHESHDAPSGGHVVKLRYTPLQSDVLAVEAPESPHHQRLVEAEDLGRMPVVAASLHSQLLPIVCAIRAQSPDARIAYVMTDGGAVEAVLSETAARLRELEWLVGVISTGQALGGDLEAVNLYSGLLAARHVQEADVAIVGMGPGVVGTGTPFGTTALELGLTVNAGASLGGRCIAAIRMSEADARDRHLGLSHHVVQALGRVALASADVAVPRGCAHAVQALASRHRIVEVEAEGVLTELERARAERLEASHMGRGPDLDPLFFLAAGAAGYHAASLIR